MRDGDDCHIFRDQRQATGTILERPLGEQIHDAVVGRQLQSFSVDPKMRFLGLRAGVEQGRLALLP